MPSTAATPTVAAQPTSGCAGEPIVQYEQAHPYRSGGMEKQCNRCRPAIHWPFQQPGAWGRGGRHERPMGSAPRSKWNEPGQSWLPAAAKAKGVGGIMIQLHGGRGGEQGRQEGLVCLSIVGLAGVWRVAEWRGVGSNSNAHLSAGVRERGQQGVWSGGSAKRAASCGMCRVHNHFTSSGPRA